ncbi:MAG TPA: glycosyltransferase family 39 protein [Aggregatilinea sp.]|jgi:4-amino-4-deoxy-L-arabinose transferase-like glycosyltransferase|uniref:ArnT family glycosyltransferase n=1 Tax=Aggregatilinea sp. TaxID=2806333 RepID=UPI002D1C7F14|nr:glycosyltransferase family 39 protein [Aggregatilinea sp.]HML24449.1 glycosyltransferase family 39 protein [Aggregatilinea sp.]
MHNSRRRSSILWIAALLLLAQFLIRVHHITVLDPYLDESYHISRASIVWQFDSNPGRFSHGKVLLYFWLGLFQAAPSAVLFTSRASIALFSLITGASIFQMGRMLHNARAGALALLLYAILPLAFFYESMAMADPFAAGFAALVAWRSLVFARHPSWREGALLGVLIALASLAKLTLALIPALPVLAALLYAPPHLVRSAQRWLRTYMPPLVLAAAIVAIAWLPLLLPAYFARNSASPFVLVNSTNVRSSGQVAASVENYGREALSLVADFTSGPMLVAAPLLIAAWMLLARADRVRSRAALFLATWMLVSVGLVIGAATLVSSRYFVPAAAPAVLLVACAAIALAERPGVQRWAGAGAAAVIVVWGVLFVGPFIRESWQNPHALPLRSTNYNEYLSGWISSDDAIRSVAQQIDHLDPPPSRIYASYTICDLLYFYSPQPVQCFAPMPPPDALRERVNEDLQPGETAYFIAYVEDNVQVDPPDVGADLVGWYERPHTNRPIWVWQIWPNGSPPPPPPLPPPGNIDLVPGF